MTGREPLFDAVSATCLVLMLKAPARSKRRLSREIGELAAVAAGRLSACALEDMAAWAGSTCFAPAAESDNEWLRAEIPPAARRILQRGGNLGERINHVNRALHELGLSRQIFIGIDCPELDQAYLEDAASRLRDHDAVLGPADDGGVVLMGARRRWPNLSALPWSTDALHEALRELCLSSGWSIATLEPRGDIDSLAGLIALKRSAHFDLRPARRALRSWIEGLRIESPGNPPET